MYLAKIYLAALASTFYQSSLASKLSDRSPQSADGIKLGMDMANGPMKSVKGTAAGTAASKTAASSTPSASAGASAAPFSKIITIVVGSPTVNKSLVFTPSEVSAAPGDILQFQFSQINHTVTQSTFAEPCMPIQASDASAAGIHSGFVPVGKNNTEVVTFDVPVNDTMPMYIYCAQGPHCQLGMVMTVNANSNQSFAAYKAAAAKATKNVPASVMKGGVMGSIPAAKAVSPPI